MTILLSGSLICGLILVMAAIKVALAGIGGRALLVLVPALICALDQLYVVNRRTRTLTPRRARALARQAVRIAELIRVEPAGSVPSTHRAG
jgi:hypothetical protein